MTREAQPVPTMDPILARGIRTLQVLATAVLIGLASINLFVNRIDPLLAVLFWAIPVATGTYAIWRRNEVFLVASAISLLLMDFRPLQGDLGWPMVTLFAVMFLGYIEAAHAGIRFSQMAVVELAHGEEEQHERIRGIMARYFRLAILTLGVTFVVTAMLLNAPWLVQTLGYSHLLVLDTLYGPLIFALPALFLFGLWRWAVRA